MREAALGQSAHGLGVVALSRRFGGCREGGFRGRVWAHSADFFDLMPGDFSPEHALAVPAKEPSSVFVCASTDCFPDLPKDEVLPTLVDLEFTAVELPIRGDARAWCSPALPVESLERAVEAFRDTHRLTIAALVVEPTATGKGYYEQFAACTKLAKALRVVPLVVPAAE